MPSNKCVLKFIFVKKNKKSIYTKYFKVLSGKQQFCEINSNTAHAKKKKTTKKEREREKAHCHLD